MIILLSVEVAAQLYVWVPRSKLPEFNGIYFQVSIYLRFQHELQMSKLDSAYYISTSILVFWTLLLRCPYATVGLSCSSQDNYTI